MWIASYGEMATRHPIHRASSPNNTAELLALMMIVLGVVISIGLALYFFP